MKFNRSFLVGVIATLVIGLAGAESYAVTSQGGGRSRTVRVPYFGPAVGVSTPNAFVTAWCHPGLSLGCATIPTKARSRFVSLEIEDLSGQDVYAMVLDQSDNELAFICGKTTSKLPVLPNSFIEVWLLEGTCGSSTKPSVATSGVVVATFSRR